MTALDVPDMELGVALKELEDHAATGCTTPDGSPLTNCDDGRQYLPAKEIKTREAVFQPRTLKGQIGEERAVMGEIREAIKRNGVVEMDRVVVWWSGKAFFCVDGHHRLAVVRKLNSEKRLRARAIDTRRKAVANQLLVPVEVLTGTLSEAMEWSTRENGKARIMLKKSDKSNWAWKVAVLHWGGIIEGRFTMAQRCKSLHVSVRTLHDMKAVYRKIDDMRSQQSEQAIIDLADMGWARAKALSEGRDLADEWTDEKHEAEVQKTVDKLISALGVNSFRTSRAAVTGEAILRVSERFLELAMGSLEVEMAVKEAAGLEEALDPDDAETEPDY